MKVLLAFLLLADSGAMLHASEQPANADDAISSGDVRNARAVRTFSPEEFARLANKEQVNCTGGTLLSSYSPDAGFVVEKKRYSPDEFAKEVIRRHQKQGFQCIEIAATCRSTMLVARLMMATKSAHLEQINLHADENVFPDKNFKLPECPK